MLLWMTSREWRPVIAPALEVELLFLPPANLPKVKADNSPIRRVQAQVPVPVSPLVTDSLTSTPLPKSDSSSDGDGSGVDWAAEARRALQAFDIRNHQPAAAASLSNQPRIDRWWPYAQHHAGEQYKTPNGDWIVWVDANCYQVASADPSRRAIGGVLGRVICPGDASARTSSTR